MGSMTMELASRPISAILKEYSSAWKLLVLALQDLFSTNKLLAASQAPTFSTCKTEMNVPLLIFSRQFLIRHAHSGIFGLNSQPVNFSSVGNYSSSSFLTTLKDQDIIPSLSWSYTAGARYRMSISKRIIFHMIDSLSNPSFIRT